MRRFVPRFTPLRPPPREPTVWTPSGKELEELMAREHQRRLEEEHRRERQFDRLFPGFRK